MTNLKKNLKKDDNGLTELAARALLDPSRVHIAIVVCNASEVKTVLSTNEKIPTIQVTQIEEVRPADVADAVRMLQRSKDARTPLHGDEHPNPVFPRGTMVDPNTGEIVFPVLEDEMKDVPGPDSENAQLVSKILSDAAVLAHADSELSDRSQMAFSADEIRDLKEATRLVIEAQLGSTVMLQRKMRIGFGKAARIMEVLQEFAIVGESQGSKGRDVLVAIEDLQMALDVWDYRLDLDAALSDPEADSGSEDD